MPKAAKTPLVLASVRKVFVLVRTNRLLMPLWLKSITPNGPAYLAALPANAFAVSSTNFTVIPEAEG